MRQNKVMKAAVMIASATLFLSFQSTKAHAAETCFAEQGIAGFAVTLENTSADEIKDAYEACVNSFSVNSPYANLGVSIADNYVNVRSEPSTESEVVGKLYRGCAADILEYLEGDWVKIESGDVKGYIASNYLAIGKEAESMVEEYATKYITVATQTLNVREEQSTECSILTQIPEGQEYLVKKEYDEWVEILLGTDEETNEDFTGYVSKEFVQVDVEFKYAISIEEENRRIQEQLEAERAEAERKQKLAQEEAERKEAARRKEQQRQQQSSSNNNKKQEEKPSSSEHVPAPSGSGSGSEIASYAQKFVGNPYKWGGESLTRGADCSGFVQAVYADFGYSLPRTSRSQASSAGRKISVDELKPGDLIFYANSSGTVNHVAIYIGDGMIVHAANSRQGIIRSKYNYRNIHSCRTIVN